MRAGGCTVQQALTAEAAAVVKQAVSLARRRGNAQVTPLHVASAMLQQQQAATSPGLPLLRAACLRSHSHPLQCKALELCFNVALNRIPASAAGVGVSPLLAGHGHGVYYPPSLSNALIAAFKRAQAHQRRAGETTAQQQAVFAVKIELEQLVISILDDPSVSRVMCEAGFSSTQIKANVEQHAHAAAVAIECSNTKPSSQNPNPSLPSPAADYQEAKPSKLPPLDQVQVREEDVVAILDCLENARSGKKRVMVVAECAAAAEAAARAAVDRIRRGEARQLMMTRAVATQVVTLAVSTFCGATRDEAERRLAELRRVVLRQNAAAVVVLVVEDLAWTAEFWAAAAGRRGAASCGGGYYYCAVEHAVAEVRALACRGGESGGVWVVGHGTYQTNMRCREGHPSLETMWGLHTVAVPAGSLALTLTCADADADADADRDDSAAMAAVNHQSAKAMCDRAGNGSTSTAHCLSLLDAPGSCSGQQMMPVSAFRGDCAVAAATKALPRSVMPPSTTTTTSIPPWLHHCRDQHEPPHMRKWMSAHGGSPSCRTALNISTAAAAAATSPYSSSVSSYEQHYYQLNHHQPYYQPWLVADDEEADETTKQHPWKSKDDSSASNGGASVDQTEERRGRTTSRFKEVSAENLKALCGALEKAVAPWQRDVVVPEIASTVLRCRSGKSSSAAAKRSRDTWMLFLGGDADAKARVARELACLVFDSPDSFVSIGGAVNSYASSPASPARSDFGEQRRKRSWPETTTTSDGHLDALYDAVKDNPRRVILMERVDRADWKCHEGIRDAIESGVVRRRRDVGGGGEPAVLGDAIVVLSCESFDDDCDDESRIKKKAKTADGTSQEEELNEDDDHQQRRKDASSSSSSCFDLNMSVEEEVFDEERRCSGEAGGGQLLLKAVDRVLFFRSMEEL